MSKCDSGMQLTCVRYATSDCHGLIQCLVFYFESLVTPCIFCALLPISVFPPFFFSYLAIFTCVSLSFLPLKVLSCVPLTSCINSPCLSVFDCCFIL